VDRLRRAVRELRRRLEHEHQGGVVRHGSRLARAPFAHLEAALAERGEEAAVAVGGLAEAEQRREVAQQVDDRRAFDQQALERRADLLLADEALEHRQAGAAHRRGARVRAFDLAEVERQRQLAEATLLAGHPHGDDEHVGLGVGVAEGLRVLARPLRVGVEVVRDDLDALAAEELVAHEQQPRELAQPVADAELLALPVVRGLAGVRRIEEMELDRGLAGAQVHEQLFADRIDRVDVLRRQVDQRLEGRARRRPDQQRPERQQQQSADEQLQPQAEATRLHPILRAARLMPVRHKKNAMPPT